MVLLAASLLGCTSGNIVSSGDSASTTTPPPPAPSKPASNANLVDAFDYVGRMNGETGYFFTTPSKRWRCAILPRRQAGCQAATATSSGMGIAGEPDTVVTPDGPEAPNVIVVERDGQAHFAHFERDEFTLTPGPAATLPFGKVMAAAGFRCNVQEIGVSCLSESTEQGFTFSPEGFTLRYTDIPV